MNKKQENELCQQLAALIGPENEYEYAVVAYISTHTLLPGRRTTARLDVVVENPAKGGNGAKECFDTSILDINGRGRTNGDGVIELKLSNFLCRDDLPDAFIPPAIVVATPLTKSPVFVTARASLTSDEKDVDIIVQSWDASGSPAPNISFNWICRIPITYIID